MSELLENLAESRLAMDQPIFVDCSNDKESMIKYGYKYNKDINYKAVTFSKLLKGSLNHKIWIITIN